MRSRSGADVGELSYSPTQLSEASLPAMASIQEAGGQVLVCHQIQTSLATGTLLLWRRKLGVICFPNRDVKLGSEREMESGLSQRAGMVLWGSCLEGSPSQLLKHWDHRGALEIRQRSIRTRSRWVWGRQRVWFLSCKP